MEQRSPDGSRASSGTGIETQAWQHQNANRKDSQSKSAVRRAKVELKKTREAGVVRFFKRLVGRNEEEQRRRDQRGLFHLLKSTEVEELRKVNSQYIRDEQGELLRNAGHPREMGAILPLAVERKI